MRIPGMGGNGNPGLPPGGKVLLPPPPPATMHSTEFQSCRLTIAAIISDEDEIEGYQIMILDPVERHKYAFNCHDDTRDALMKFFSQCPRIGERVPSDEAA